ncbi:hypothetical protein OROHE_002475 [Orobanche hederae]
MVARDKRTGKTKGCGFVSFLDRGDLAGAIKDMNDMLDIGQSNFKRKAVEKHKSLSKETKGGKEGL